MTKIDQPEHDSVPAGINPEQTKIKATLVARLVASPRVQSEIDTIAPGLFNLEPRTAPDKPLGLKVNLYQMENP